jgi:hypothetical protein
LKKGEFEEIKEEEEYANSSIEEMSVSNEKPASELMSEQTRPAPF